jgi:hypothetical protein
MAQMTARLDSARVKLVVCALRVLGFAVSF